MNAIFAILLTLVWLTSWAGILLGRASCLTPRETAQAPALVVAAR